MPSRNAKKRKVEPALPKKSKASVKTSASPDLAERLTGHIGIAFQIFIFLVAFVIIFSRRPDALLHAQFYAEDGTDFYPAGYQFGLHSFLIPVAGYLHTFTRIVVLFALLFPFSLAPLVMNVCAIVVQILPVNVFLSSRFSEIGIKQRLLASLLYLAIPNSYEINANITNVQWHLTLLACLLLLAQPGGRAWRYFDGVVLVLTSLSSPIGILLVPVAAALWWKRRQSWSKWSLALLIPGAVIQILMALLSHSREQLPNGATAGRLIAILGRQVFFSSLLGVETQSVFASGQGTFMIEIIAAGVGVALLLYSLRYGPLELKLFIVFAFAVLALSLAHPMAGNASFPQWQWLCVPRCATRYFFLPMLASLASLFWIAGNSKASATLRYFVLALLMLLPIGIYQDWRYAPFDDLGFEQYAAQFENAPAGTTVTIPIYPAHSMTLTKR